MWTDYRIQKIITQILEKKLLSQTLLHIQVGLTVIEERPQFSYQYHPVPSQTSRAESTTRNELHKRTIAAMNKVTYSALHFLVMDSAAKWSDCPHVLIYSLSFCKHTEQRPSVQPNRSHDTFATWSGSIL